MTKVQVVEAYFAHLSLKALKLSHRDIYVILIL
jgi:hypothetical protein